MTYVISVPQPLLETLASAVAYAAAQRRKDAKERESEFDAKHDSDAADVYEHAEREIAKLLEAGPSPPRIVVQISGGDCVAVACSVLARVLILNDGVMDEPFPEWSHLWSHNDEWEEAEELLRTRL